MNRIACITPGDALPGFRLAGVSHFTATRATVVELLRQLTAEGEHGLIAIDERLLDEATEEYLSRRQETWQGVFVVLPPPSPAAEEGDYAERLLRRAIGYQVRLG
ncbi:MAG: V-type ATP synthase subunit F [Thermodesulfobacteriota bacterium]